MRMPTKTAIARWFPATLSSLVACALVLVFGTVSAGAQSSQKIAVLVNDQAISEFDIIQRSRLLKLSGAKGGLRNRAVRELIEERLKIQEARRLGISVSKEDVDQALLGIAERTRTGTISRLSKALGSSGVNIKTLRNRFEAEIGWNQVVRRRFQREIRIRDGDILAAMRGQDDPELQKTTEYQLTQVIAVIPENASKSLLAERKRTAEKIRSNVRSCGNIRSIASAFRDVTVREIGTRTSDQLPDDLTKQLETLPVGRAALPVRQPEGYVVMVVCDKAEITGFEAARTPIENELRNEQGLILARRLLRDLRADALIEYR